MERFKRIDVLVVFISVFLLNTFRFPSLILKAEPYAETGKIYFHLAHHYSFFENLMFADGFNYPSYYPLLGRILTWITAKLPANIGITYFPELANGLGLLFIAIFVSLFYYSLNKKFSVNIFSALLFSIVITLHNDIGLYFLFNLGYFCIFLSLYFLFSNPEKFNKLEFGILSLLGFLTLMSKPYFIAFLPFYFLLFLYSLYKKKTKSSLFYFSLLVPLFILLYNLIVASNVNAKTGIVKLSFGPLIERVFYFTFYSLGYSIFGFFGFSNVIYASVLSAICWLIFFIFILVLVKRKNYENVIFSLILMVIAGVCTTMTVIAFKHSVPINWSEAYKFPDNSHFLFTLLLSLTAFFILFSNIFKSYKIQLPFIVLITICSGCFGYFASSKDPYLLGEKARSNWKNYAPIIISSIKNNSYCIPTNPSPWVVNRNCIWLTKEVHIDSGEITKILSNEKEGLFVNGVEIAFYDERIKKGLELILFNSNQKPLKTYSSIWEKGRPFSFYKVDTELTKGSYFAFKSRNGKLTRLKASNLKVFGCPLSNRECYELLSANYFNL